MLRPARAVARRFRQRDGGNRERHWRCGENGGSGSGGTGGGIPGAETFYFKIPSNAKLLGYWTTVADRLYKLRHCQNIAGAALQLALFDAPIDPGLLIAAQAAGVDLLSVLSDLGASLPNYRFTSLYPQALDFVNAVRAYGASLQAALEKTDAGALALLQQTTQQQLLNDGNDILDWQVQQAQSNIDALTQTLALAQQKYTFNTTQPFGNAASRRAQPSKPLCWAWKSPWLFCMPLPESRRFPGFRLVLPVLAAPRRKQKTAAHMSLGGPLPGQRRQQRRRPWTSRPD